MRTHRRQPRRRWKPRELVGVALAEGPVPRPGERFAYASTNYVLLGMVAPFLLALGAPIRVANTTIDSDSMMH